MKQETIKQNSPNVIKKPEWFAIQRDVRGLSCWLEN